jgi:hypothetical protein
MPGGQAQDNLAIHSSGLFGDVRELVLPAVFKTVCGALLRRPGWVRFPSIPAKSGLMTATPATVCNTGGL